MDSWEFEENLNSIDFEPKTNYYFDLWQYDDGSDLDIHEGTLIPENLETYLAQEEWAAPTLSSAQNGSLDRRLIGSLRIIYSSSDSGHDRLIMMSRSHFEKVMRSFHLPKRFAEMIDMSHCVLSECFPNEKDIINCGNSERLSYILSTPFDHRPLWSLTASWDPQTNITSAYLQCSSSNAGDKLIPRLKRYLAKVASQGTIHPLLPALAVIDLETNATMGDDTHFNGLISDVEDAVGLGDLHKPETDVTLSPYKRVELTQKTNAASLFITQIERESEVVLYHLDEMMRILDDIMFKKEISGAVCVEGREIEGTAMKVRIRTATQRLQRHVRFLVNARKNLLVRLKALQKKCGLLLSLLYHWPNEASLQGSNLAGNGGAEREP